MEFTINGLFTAIIGSKRRKTRKSIARKMKKRRHGILQFENSENFEKPDISDLQKKYFAIRGEPDRSPYGLFDASTKLGLTMDQVFNLGKNGHLRSEGIGYNRKSVNHLIARYSHSKLEEMSRRP